MPKGKKTLKIYHVGELISIEHLYKKIYVVYCDTEGTSRYIEGVTVDISYDPKIEEHNFVILIYGNFPEEVLIEIVFQSELNTFKRELYIDKPEFAIEHIEDKGYG